MPELSRRAYLGSVTAGLVASSGCLSLGNAFSSSNKKGNIPLANHPNYLDYDLKFLQEHVMSGGVPKDGIPSIDNPKFVDVSRGNEIMEDGDIVFGVKRNGVVKAYPQHILVHHEIVNDVLNDEPVSVTYCPLTGTVIGYRRGDTTFGVSGNLLNNNLVMYDRATDSRWPQILGRAISGSYKNKTLQEFRVIWTTWERWRDAFPDTQVLSRDTGYARNYEVDPYGAYNPRRGYYKLSASPLFPALRQSDLFKPKRIVIGARNRNGAAAFLKDTLRSKKLMRGTIGDSEIIAVYDDELDTGYIYYTKDTPKLTVKQGQIVNTNGESIEPERLPGSKLLSFDAMWFAWYGLYPSTNVYY